MMRKVAMKVLVHALIICMLIGGLLPRAIPVRAAVPEISYLGEVTAINAPGSTMTIQTDSYWDGHSDWIPYEDTLESQTSIEDVLDEIEVGDYVEARCMGGYGQCWGYVALGKMQSETQEFMTDIYGDPRILVSDMLDNYRIEYENTPDCSNCSLGSCGVEYTVATIVSQGNDLESHRLYPGESFVHEGEHRIDVAFNHGSAPAYPECSDEPFIGPQTFSDFTVHILDTTPPAAIDDLTATPGTYPGDVVLSWTAPGDDGNSGTASAYIVKYWSWPIVESEWIYATDVDNEPTPSPDGSTEAMTVNLKPRRRYYFAVKAQDEAGNLSDISNSPSAWAAGRLISDINSDLVYDPDSILGYQVTVLAIPARTDDWTFGTDHLIRAISAIGSLRHAMEIGEKLVTEGLTKGGAHSLFIAFKAIALHIAFDTLSQLRAQLLWGLHSTEDGDPMLLVWDPEPELMDSGVPYVITGTVREKELRWPLQSFYYLEVTNDGDIDKHQPSPTDPHFPIPTGYEYKYWYDLIFPGTAYGDDFCTIGMVNERYLVDDEHYVTIRLLDHRSPDAPPSGLIVRVPSSEPAPTQNSMAMFCGTKRQAAIGEEIYDSEWGTSVDYYLNTTEESGDVEVLQGKTSTITHHEYAEEPQLAVGTGSPVDIHIYDPDGNHVGAVYDADGSIVDYENQIQGAEHMPGADDAPEVASILNPIASSYTVVIRGTDTGVYTQTMSIRNRSSEQTYTSTLTGQSTSAGQEDTTVVDEIPSAPTGLELEVNGSTINLDWDNNTESDLAGYNVYRSTQANGVYQKMNDSLLPGSSFTDSSAGGSTVYYYVTAEDTDHNESGHLAPVAFAPEEGGYLIYLPLILRSY
jgi:hypothetical protein